MQSGIAHIERRFVQTRSGKLHIAACGDGFPVLLLHQTPRSWDEYRDVLPLLGQNYRAIAMDTVGFGNSQPLPPGSDSIEAWASAAHDLLDALELRAGCRGRPSHRGRHRDRDGRESTGTDQGAGALGVSLRRRGQASDAVGKKLIDHVDRHVDGRHLLELWTMRQPFYPEGDIHLLERFIIDALKAGERAAAGHHVVHRYVMETRLPLVRCPTLVIAPTADPHAYPHARKVADALHDSRVVEIENGMVPLPDQMPELFARVVDQFLAQALAGAR